MCILGIMSQIHCFHLQMWIFYSRTKEFVFRVQQGATPVVWEQFPAFCSVTSVDLMSLCSVVVFTSRLESERSRV